MDSRRSLALFTFLAIFLVTAEMWPSRAPPLEAPFAATFAAGSPWPIFHGLPLPTPSQLAQWDPSLLAAEVLERPPASPFTRQRLDLEWYRAVRSLRDVTRRKRLAALARLYSEQLDPWQTAHSSLARLATADAPCAVLNDLAVLEIARAEKSPELLLAAFDRLRSAQEDASCPEASWNFAGLAETLGLWGTAARTWQALAEKKALAPADWAKERSAKLLAARLGLGLPTDLQRARRRDLEQGFADWAEALRKAPSSAAAQETAVAARLEHGGDALYRVLFAELQAPEPPPGLVEGLRALRRARGDAPYSSCGAELLAADAFLAQAGTPYRALTLIDRGVCAFFERDLRLAEALLEEAVALGQRLSSKVLLARTAFLLSLIRNQEGRFLEAEPLAAQSQELYRELGEFSEVDYAWGLRAKIAQAAGATQQAWRWRIRGLAARASVPTAERVFNLLEEARLAAEMDGNLPLALRFLEEGDVAAQRAHDRSPDLEIFSAVDGASLLLALGDEAAARRWLARGERQWELLPPSNESREHQKQDLAVLRTSLPGSDTRDRLDALAAAQQFFGRDPGGDQAELLHLHRLAAEAHVAAGSLTSALAEIDRGLAAAERQNLDNVDALQRALLSARTRDLVDLGVDLELKRGEVREALRRLEEGSQKVLRSSATRPASQAEAIGRAERGERTILRYGVLPDRLVLWVLGRSAIHHEERPVSAEELRKEVAACGNALQQARKSVALIACRRVSELVLPHGLAETSATAAWTLIPDGPLLELPFAGLPLASGEMLLEKVVLSYAPSVGALDLAPAPREPLRRALVVGNPAFDPRLFPLKNLVNAEESAAQFASVFALPRALVGQEATKKNVLAELPAAELFYFAGHGLGKEAPGERGGLLLAPDPAKEVDLDALLTATDINPLDLARLRLVVLASCRQSAFDTAYGAREQLGLASAFLARGARSVLLSSWPIDDLEAADFFVSFAREFAQNPDAAKSLRTTQLRSIAEEKNAAAYIGYKILER